MRLAPFEAVLLIDGDEVVEQEGVGALAAIFRKYTDEQTVYNVGLLELQGTDDMPPAERPQTTVTALLQSLCQRGDGDTYADTVVVGRVPVFDDAEQVQFNELEVHVHILVYLFLRHLRVAVEVTEGLVDNLEDTMTIFLRTEDVLFGQLPDVQVVALHGQLCHAFHLFGHAALRYKDLILNVVVIFLVALHLLHQTGIVFIIIQGSHGAELVETVSQHTLWIHICEAQRTDDFLHALLLTVFLYGIQQGTHHLCIVNEVQPAEADARALPLLVVSVIDDSCHTTYNFSVAISQEIFCLAEFEC